MASNNINISSSTTTPSQSWLSPPPVAPHLPKYSAAADNNNNDNNTYTYTDIDIDIDRPRRDTTNTNTNNSNSNSNTDLKYNYSGLTHSDHDRSRPNLDTADRDFKYNHSGLTSNHSGLIHNHSGLIYDDEEEHISVVPLAQQYPQFSRDRLHVDSSDDEGGDDVGYKNNNNNNHNKSSNSNHFVGKGANYNYSYKRPPSSSAAASRSRPPLRPRRYLYRARLSVRQTGDSRIRRRALHSRGIPLADIGARPPPRILLFWNSTARLEYPQFEARRNK